MKFLLKKYSTVISIFFGWYIVIALNLDLAVSKQQLVKTFEPGVLTFLASFKTHNNVQFFLFFFFSYILLKKSIRVVTESPFAGWKNCLLYITPAALFSVFMIVGFSFKTTGFASCITFSKYQLFKSLFAGGGYFILFLCLILVLFDKIEHLSLFSAEPVSEDSRLRYFCRHPFIVSYLILFICYIPYIIISYPGIFMGDTWDQISQGYNLPFFHPAVNLISEKVKLINHHPVFHTLLLHYFIVLGKSIRSYNFGVFLFAFFQLTLFITVISFSIKVLIKRFRLKLKYAIIILLYFLIHPFVQNYMMLIAKDVLFAIFFLLFLLFSFLFLEQGTLSCKQYFIWLWIMLGVVLFRNEGIYLIVPTLLYMLFLDLSKKRIASAMAIIVCVFLAWHHVVFPFFKITPGSVREMLSIPFQQTARYVKYNSQKVTQNEMMTIDAVLDYKTIGKRYNPNLADPVKWAFKEKSTTEQRLCYLKTWARMFFKEPKLYIGAIVANKYEYFYPEANLAWFYGYGWSEWCMKVANKNKEISFGFHHLKKLKEHREKYERSRTVISGLPIFNLLRSASTYIWMFILLIFYALRQRNKRLFALFVPFIMYFLVLMAGPCNGTYFRYLYPYVVAFPFLFIFTMYLKDEIKT